MKVPQIDNGKLPEKLLNNDLFLLLPSETPFGNMALKHLKIIKRIDYVNFKLKAIYDQWEKIRLRPTNSSDMIANVSHMLKIQNIIWFIPLHIEETIYLIRKITDELISICYLLHEYKINSVFPKKLKVDAIAKFLELSESHTLTVRLIGSKLFLTKLNDISNAYKHSFINSDIDLMGQYEPIVPALALKDNNLLKNDPKLHIVSLSQVIVDFNFFYISATEFISDHNPGHRITS